MAKKLFYTFAVIFVFILAISNSSVSVAEDKEGHDLSWQLEVGQRIPYSITLKATGKYSPAIEGVDDIEIDTTLDCEIIVSKKVGDAYTCELNCKSIKGTIKHDRGLIMVNATKDSSKATLRGPRGTINIDLPNPIKTTKSFVLGKRGGIIWTKQIADIRAFFLAHIDHRFLQTLIVMQNESVETGTKMTKTIVFPIPANKDNIEANIDYKYEVLKNYKNVKCMYITAKGSKKFDNIKTIDKQGRDVLIQKGSITGSGYSYFALKGYLARLYAKNQLSFKAKVDGKTHSFSGNVEFSVTKK